MKKLLSAMIVYAVAVFSFSSALQPNKANARAMDSGSSYRVLDYTWNCVGSGGNCLDTVVIIAPKK